MPRVKRGNVSRKRHKKVLKHTKGFQGPLSKLYRPAHQAYLHSLSHAFRDRRRKKRDFRSLWIIRLNAGLRALGITYSSFISKATTKEIALNRKVLSELAISKPDVFKQIVDIVKK